MIETSNSYCDSTYHPEHQGKSCLCGDCTYELRCPRFCKDDCEGPVLKCEMQEDFLQEDINDTLYCLNPLHPEHINKFCLCSNCPAEDPCSERPCDDCQGPMDACPEVEEE